MPHFNKRKSLSSPCASLSLSLVLPKSPAQNWLLLFYRFRDWSLLIKLVSPWLIYERVLLFCSNRVRWVVKKNGLGHAMQQRVVNPRTQTLFKPTPSQTLGENHPIFGQLKIHTCNQVLIKVQKFTKNIAPWFSFPLRSKYWTETKLWMGEVEKCNTYYTMYHKRRVEITRNALCGKIPGSELFNTPSFGL